MYYNVTLIMAGASGNIGSSGGYYESGSLSASNLNLPTEFGPFSVLAGDTGVLIRFYPYYAGSYFRATVCPFQAVPTAMPTQMLAPGKHLPDSPYQLHFIVLCLSASNMLAFLFLTIT